MTTPARQREQLPDWLAEALEGEVTDNVLNKRDEPRHVCYCIVCAHPDADLSAKPVSVRLFNAGPGGVGFIARQPFRLGARLALVPDATTGPRAAQAVHVHVIHCTRTVQGYKVGCAIDAEPA